MLHESIQNFARQGLILRHQLRGHSGAINRIAWSPNGLFLASPSDDGSICLWDLQTGQIWQKLVGNVKYHTVTWSPDSRLLACGTSDKKIALWDTLTGKCVQTIAVPIGCRNVVWSPKEPTLASCSLTPTIHLWNTETGQFLQTLPSRSGWINSIAWFPSGRFLTSGSISNSREDAICLWDMQTGKFLRAFPIDSSVYTLAWSPDGQALYIGCSDQTIRVWDPQTQKQIRTLEGHTSVVTSISSSYDGRFLASKSYDGTVCIWVTSTWEMIAIIEKPTSSSWFSSLDFHPNAPLLATLDERDTVICIWELDTTTLLKNTPVTPSVHYTNAKIVLVGDSGVGKSGLSLVLTGQPFVATVSTHGRRIWTLDSQKFERDNGCIEVHETLLWDLAGQPGYHLIHQLHLNQVALTLVVFDAHNESSPLAGVYYWVHAQDTAKRVEDNTPQAVKKFLVAGRIDCGTKNISQERIDSLMQELGFDGYFETSAKEGWGIEELINAIKGAIDWEMLPKVTSTHLFQRIKAFLIDEKQKGRLMSTSDELYQTFLISEKLQGEPKNLRAEFETCIGRVELADLIKRLSFGNLVLLQPELLDAYASALIISVRNEPDGLGSISEMKAREGDFRMPSDERLRNREQEKLLLIAMIEDLLSREIVLREGGYLVFPSQLTREYPELADPEGKTVVFGFKGPVLSIYATLAVRLSQCGRFKKKEIWKNAITFTAHFGGICGILLRNTGEGYGEFTLFFDKIASEETRKYFEDYVKMHLLNQANEGSIQRRRIFVCPGCTVAFTDSQVMRRQERGLDWISCSVCDTKVSLLEEESRKQWVQVVNDPIVVEMNQVATTQREREVAVSQLQGKRATEDFDVFLCYNNQDKVMVKTIGEKLKERGILPWLDEWEARPGLPWQRLLERQIGQIKSAAVFIGANGIGPWGQIEIDAFLRQFIKRECPVIPVILPYTSKEVNLPIFLEGMTQVDFRRSEPDQITRLIWGITGRREPSPLLDALKWRGTFEM